MMHASSKMLWVHPFLQELGFPIQGGMAIYYDNQGAIFLSNNLNFHKCTKHIEIYFHAIRHWVLDGFVNTLYVGSSQQLADIVTKRIKYSLL